MSQQPKYALHPRQSRAPQHAAALSGNAGPRGRTHRLLKLLAIATAWVIGLLAVIAAVTTVAVATAPTVPAARTSHAGTTAGRPVGSGPIPVAATGPEAGLAGRPRADHGTAGHRTIVQRPVGPGRPSQPGQADSGNTTSGRGSGHPTAEAEAAMATPATAAAIATPAAEAEAAIATPAR